MKLWTMPCRVTQDGQVVVESSDKMWCMGEGNGKLRQYSYLENPVNSMKRQKDRTLKYEFPRSVGTKYATGEEWRHSSRKNEETEPKWKECPVTDVTGDGRKSHAVQNSIAKEPGILSLWIRVNWKWTNRRWQDWTSTI